MLCISYENSTKLQYTKIRAKNNNNNNQINNILIRRSSLLHFLLKEVRNYVLTKCTIWKKMQANNSSSQGVKILRANRKRINFATLQLLQPDHNLYTSIHSQDVKIKFFFDQRKICVTQKHMALTKYPLKHWIVILKNIHFTWTCIFSIAVALYLSNSSLVVDSNSTLSNHLSRPIMHS